MIIKEMRIAAGLSRAEMSKEFEIPIRTLENWESGTRKPPDWAVKMITERLKSMKKDLYTQENLYLMGEAYHLLLLDLKKSTDTIQDPYSQISDIYPFKCITMILPRVTSIGMSKITNVKVAQLMELIDPDDVNALMITPTPKELRMNWWMGFSKYKKINREQK